MLKPPKSGKGKRKGISDCRRSNLFPLSTFLFPLTLAGRWRRGGSGRPGVPSLSLPRPCAITQFQTETFWRNRLSPERLRESIQYLAIAKSLDYSFAIFLSWYLKNKVPPIAISKTDPTTINVFIFFCFLLFLLSYLHLPSTARILRL